MHEATLLDGDILGTAFAFANAKLLLVAGLLRRLGKEQKTAIALDAVATGMLELVGEMHAQVARTQRNTISLKGVLVTFRKGTVAIPTYGARFSYHPSLA